MSKVHKSVTLNDCRSLGQTDFEYLHTAACGYVRDNVTESDSDVTCFYCLRVITQLSKDEKE